MRSHWKTGLWWLVLLALAASMVIVPVSAAGDAQQARILSLRDLDPKIEGIAAAAMSAQSEHFVLTSYGPGSGQLNLFVHERRTGKRVFAAVYAGAPLLI